MAKVDISLYGYVRDPAQLRAAATLDRWLASLTAQGYHLIAESELDSLKAWWQPQLQPQTGSSRQARATLQPGRSPLLQQHFNAYTRGQVADFACTALATARTGMMQQLLFQFSLSTDEGIVSAAIQDIYFTQIDPQGQQSPDNATRYDIWLALLKEISMLWHPLFAFTFNGEMDDFTTRDEALALAPRALADIMLLGPDLVAKFGGMSRIAAAPVWRVDALADGGALIVVVPSFITPTTYDRQSAADYLGLPFHRIELDAIRRLQQRTNQP